MIIYIEVEADERDASKSVSFAAGGQAKLYKNCDMRVCYISKLLLLWLRILIRCLDRTCKYKKQKQQRLLN